MTLTIVGFVCGLWAAVFQSFSYLATRHFLQVRSGGTRKLMTLSHVWMGGVSLALLPFLWPSSDIPWRAIILPLLGTAGCYLLGQFGLLLALRRAQPTQVSPVLVLKLLMLAVLTVTIKGAVIAPLQWVAVIMCISGTLMLYQHPHDRLPITSLLGALFAACFYGLSDWSISYLVPAFGSEIPLWQAIMCSSLMAYIFCGLVALPFLPVFGSKTWADWKDAFPFAATWLLGMFGLFAAFAILGVVYGGILQSTRTIFGVFLAALLTRLGFTHIEDMTSRAMFFRRLTAAALTTLAVILWAIPALRTLAASSH